MEDFQGRPFMEMVGGQCWMLTCTHVADIQQERNNGCGRVAEAPLTAPVQHAQWVLMCLPNRILFPCMRVSGSGIQRTYRLLRCLSTLPLWM